jgi:hypothetical protein
VGERKTYPKVHASLNAPKLSLSAIAEILR